ncbi:MAG: LamG domain-containing protein [Lentisphaerae bacterium]|jgi:hypothetical protein|nr:LamG domain-containing protein [Lentisphaerota bacterium]MBT4821366.1 LamG domain-containing protein [Lentisphaerota bacterium]MBT5609519.1 LamG domain-containing protein [Lentisphaerota bacterium]MBT7058483.1 LamG domain-containing protein [Lentisphaerota bacterium]MBT7845933.1 LamG domain-containing protein [Lentisphaerota bacterium]
MLKTLGVPRIATISAVLMAFAWPPHSRAAAPIAHYTFNEGRGTVARDRSGAGRSAKVLGATYVGSPRGYALRFDGIDDQVTYAGNAGLGLRGAFTFTIWLRVDLVAGAGTTRLVFGDTANRSVARNLNIKLDKYDRIHVEWGNGESYVQLTAKADLLHGGWHHLAVSCDTEGMKAVLCLDGDPVAERTIPFGAASPRPGRPVRSGYWWEGNAFSGEIDDIKLFDVALTADEIGELVTLKTELEMIVDAELAPLLPATTGLAGPVNRDGLVAHYTFEEGSGQRLVDHSGNEHHGTIHGAVWTTSPWGGALDFDGTDDYVNLGQAEDFWFTGSMSIEMWIRTTPVYPQRKHPLLIGSSAADLAVERHFNVRLDHTKHFRLEWGDGARYASVVEKPWFLDGGWKHLAVVLVSGKACFLYVNGELVVARSAGLPLTRTRGDDIHIGGWFHGHLRGHIADVRLYSRAISAVEIQRNGGKPPEQCEPLLRATGAYSYHKQAFLCDIFASVDVRAGHTVAARVLDPTTRAILGERLLTASELGGGTGHSYARITVPGESQTDGDHILETVLHDEAGTVLHRTESDVPYAAPPEWLHSKAGVTEEVLPPYTPCVFTTRGDGSSLVATWGREHCFGADGLLGQVVSGGRPLLAGPVDLHAAADGRSVAWPGSTPEAVFSADPCVKLKKQVATTPFLLRTDITVDYDGFMLFKCALAAQRDTTLQRLVLDVPLVPAIARLFHAWPVSKAGHSGALPDSWSGPFKPVLWIGDEERGLSWVCESEQHWRPANDLQAVEVIRGEAATVLRFNLVGQDLVLTAGHELRYTFGLQATPVKPMTRDFWDMRLHRQRPYAHEYDWMTKTIDGVPALKHYADNGARGLLVWRWWDAFGYTLPLGHEKRFPDLVKACHDHGIKLVPYTIGFLLSDAAPEYRTFRRDMLTEPEKGFTGVNRLPGLPNQMAYYACPGGLWRDFVTATTAQCMDEYDTDGVYLDTTVRPEPCTNALHGCGWTREDGTRAPTYPVLAIRDLMKRLYAIVSTRKADGFVDAHIYDCLNVPALAFSTGYWNGEQLEHGETKVDSLPLDRFRTEFMGHNIGVPADLLFYKLRDYESSVAIAILHDVPVRCEQDSDFETIAGIYRVRDEFGCEEARFHGYWESDSAIGLDGESCYASYWQHQQNGVLVAVSNLSAEPQDVRLIPDLPRLGLGSAAGAVNLRPKGGAVSASGDAFTVPLGPQAWTLIQLQSR